MLASGIRRVVIYRIRVDARGRLAAYILVPVYCKILFNNLLPQTVSTYLKRKFDAKTVGIETRGLHILCTNSARAATGYRSLILFTSYAREHPVLKGNPDVTALHQELFTHTRQPFGAFLALL